MAVSQRVPKMSSEQDALAKATDLVGEIGDRDEEIEKLNAEMNEKLKKIKEEYEQKIKSLSTDRDRLVNQLFLFAKQNRNILTRNEKTKTVKTTWGDICWRFTRLAVIVADEEAAVDELEKKKLSHLVDMKVVKTVDKNAVLKEPDAIKDLQNIRLRKVVEEFVIKPVKSKIICRLSDVLKICEEQP